MHKKNAPDWTVTGTDTLGRPVYSRQGSTQGGSVGGSVSDIRSEVSGSDRWGCDVYERDIPISSGAMKVIDILTRDGMTPLVVGGYVRDHLMGLTSKDIDIEVHDVDSIDEVISSLRKQGMSVDTVGQSFGVLKTMVNGDDLDISLPRRDSLADDSGTHRSIRADVDGRMGIHESARRRDFTINAMMYSPQGGLILDPHGGMSDMNDRILRAVDEHTFVEDPLRVLRGVQFAGRFDMDMDEDTVQMCSRVSPDRLASERIAGEMHKLALKSTSLHNGVVTLHEVGWGHLTPTMTKNLDTPINQFVVDRVCDGSIPIHARMAMVTAMMDHHYGDGSGALAETMMLSRKEKMVFRALDLSRGSDLLTMSRMRRTLHAAGVDQDLAAEMTSAVGVTPARTLWTGDPPAYVVNGQILSERGVSQGPAWSRIITAAKDIQDSGVDITDAVIDDLVDRHG